MAKKVGRERHKTTKVKNRRRCAIRKTESVSTRCPSNEELRTTIRQFDPHMPEDSLEFKAALVQFAGLHIGTGDLKRLSKVTGVRREIHKFAKNLRVAGIWTKDGMTSAKWWGKGGEINFWIDVAVATGMVKLHPGDLDPSVQ